jgi:putative endonuclease
MPVFSRVMFGLVNFAARKGIHDGSAEAAAAASKKRRARSTGIRGETFAYWFLRRHGYIIVARNYKVPGLKGEIDLIGFDGEILAFIEVKTRSAGDEAAGLPEDAVNTGKRRAISRIARAFLKSTRRFNDVYRFDILAIEARSGRAPVVRLHKDAFAEQH